MSGSGHTSIIPLSRTKTLYEEFNEKASDGKSVWYYFLRATDKQSAQCKMCKKILKSTGGSTTGLRTHLRSAHVILLEDKQDAPHNQENERPPEALLPPPKKAKLTDYFLSKNTVEARVSRMASLDGTPLRNFCTSEDLQDLFKIANLKLPRSPNSIKKMILDYVVKIQQELRVELDALKMQGCKFALTFDEWTSTRNRRYMNVNIHSQMLSKTQFRNLGLIRIQGAMPAEKCIALLEKRLSLYKISLYTDIAGITTDGASVMAKVGRSLKMFHQLCFAHGIQLAVLDVLYKKNPTTSVPVSVAEKVPNQDDNIDDDENVSEENDEGSYELIHTSEENSLEDQNFQNLVKKVRKITHIFRKSPSKNEDILQKYVREEFGKELNLIQDCPTRWSSLADMIKRFIHLKKCVSKALIDLKSNLSFSEQEIQTLTAIEKCLDVIKATVEALCRRDANLITAETAMRFMMRKLKEQNTYLSNDLAKALGIRIIQRRTLASSILMYLNNPTEYFNVDDDSIFLNHSSEEVTNGLVSLHQSKNKDHEKQELTVARTSDSDCDVSENSSLLIAEELEKELLKCQAPKDKYNTKREDEDNIQNIISVEMVLYENGGSRGQYLEEAYKYLSSITPTSVEAERAFSSAGYICSKIRSSLSDETLDALSFLRAHFQQQKK